MANFDFDLSTQEIFNTQFSDISKTNWLSWLDIKSKEDFEGLALKNSKMDTVDDLFQKIKSETTNSKEFTIEIHSYLKKYNKGDIPILCHTSGTTNPSKDGIKWFHMSKSLIQSLWAPGMQAIFETSGLDESSSAVIFVPSRMSSDGINTIEDKEYISLYSSEFSQRLTVSLIKPAEYSFYQYKDSKNLKILAQLLEIENISVISAPATTVMGWADISKLKNGIQKSYNDLKHQKIDDDITENILKKVESEGINSIARQIQSRLSKKLKNATLIFGISSLTSNKWDLLYNFMNWERGHEKFTNLYVGSEIGPFAASISKSGFDMARKNKMYVFPLTIPVISHKGELNLITRTEHKFGKLLISRKHNSEPLINIDTGDVITIERNGPIPQIGGGIVRSGFELQYNISFSENVHKDINDKILAGDYFNFDGFTIFKPRNLLNCIINEYDIAIDALLLVKEQQSEESYHWLLYIPQDSGAKNFSNKQIKKIVGKCPNQEDIFNGLMEDKIKLKLINEPPVDFYRTRSEILQKVRDGQIPKGILKKWPLYIILPR